MLIKPNAFLACTLFSVCLHLIVLTLANSNARIVGPAQQTTPNVIKGSLINLNSPKIKQQNTMHAEPLNSKAYDLASPKTVSPLASLDQNAQQTISQKLNQLADEHMESSEKFPSSDFGAQTSDSTSTGESKLPLLDTAGLMPVPLLVPLSMLLTWPANLKQDVSVRLESYWKDGKLELKMTESSGNPAFDAYAQAYAQYQLDNATTELSQQQYYFTLTR